MSTVKIEESNQNNLEALARLMFEMWPQSSYKEELQDCQRILRAQDETCYLLKDQNSYVAFIYLKMRQDFVEGSKSSPVAYIEGIYVCPTHRKLGLASRLVNKAEQWAHSMGSSQLASDAEINNESSIAFHKNAGFREANRVVCLIKDLN